jgi:hypothetical protein
MEEQQPPKGVTLSADYGENIILGWIANGIVVPTDWRTANDRGAEEVSFSRKPLSPEAELALYREFDITDDPRPGIRGERYDSTRDLQWLQGSREYYARFSRGAFERLRVIRATPATSPSASGMSRSEGPAQARTPPAAPRVPPTSRPSVRTPPVTPGSGSGSARPPAAKPAPVPASSPPVSAQQALPGYHRSLSLAAYDAYLWRLHGEAYRLGFKSGWPPLVRWMFSWVLHGSWFLSGFLVFVMKLVAVFLGECVGVLVGWLTLVSIQYVCLAFVVDHLTPTRFHLPLP